MLSQIHSPTSGLPLHRPGTAVALAGTLLCATVSSVAVAQQSVRAQTIGGNSVPVASTVQVAPQTITVDPETKIASVKFINPGSDSARADVSVQYMPLGSKSNSAQNDSLANLWSLASWVQDAPKKVALAPHETLTVKLHLAVPAKLTPGDYSAYVVATPAARTDVSNTNNADNAGDGNTNGFQVTFSGGQTVTLDQVQSSSDGQTMTLSLVTTQEQGGAQGAASAGSASAGAQKPGGSAATHKASGKIVYHAVKQ